MADPPEAAPAATTTPPRRRGPSVLETANSSWSVSALRYHHENMGPIVPTVGGFALVKLGEAGGSPFKGKAGVGLGLSPVRSSDSTPYAPGAGNLLLVSENYSGGHSADGTQTTAAAAGGCATCHPVTSSPSSSPARRAHVTIIRSVDEDEEEKYGDEETMEGEGGRLGDGSQEGRAAAASVPGSARTSRSSSSGTAPLCCRNCGSTEVVKKNSSLGSASLDSLKAAAVLSGVPLSTCKLLVVGNAKCGKTSVIRRFVQGNFQNAYISTVGADYLKRDVVLRDGRPVRLQLWDIAGQDRFVHLTRAYFRRAKGVLVVCDLTRENTFEAVKAWKKEIDEWARLEGREAGIPVVLIANKCDMLTDATDSFLAGANMVAMCHEQKFASWYVTSAKSGNNVDDAFFDLVERAMEVKEEKEMPSGGEKEGGGGKGEGGFKLSAVDGMEERGVRGGGGAFGWSMC